LRQEIGFSGHSHFVDDFRLATFVDLGVLLILENPQRQQCGMKSQPLKLTTAFNATLAAI
jgi:hypothetical protein